MTEEKILLEATTPGWDLHWGNKERCGREVGLFAGVCRRVLPEDSNLPVCPICGAAPERVEYNDDREGQFQYRCCMLNNHAIYGMGRTREEARENWVKICGRMSPAETEENILQGEE